jgi:hypothetical protein
MTLTPQLEVHLDIEPATLQLQALGSMQQGNARTPQHALMGLIS